MSSILEQVANTDAVKYNNYDANFAVHELAEIQESFPTIPTDLPYTEEMVPVIKLEGIKEGQDCSYCVDGECFTKLLKSQGYSITDAIGKLFNQIESDPSNKITNTCEMAIVLKEENIDELYNIITQDTNKISIRCESINKHIDFIKQIQETGCGVIFSKR